MASNLAVTSDNGQTPDHEQHVAENTSGRTPPSSFMGRTIERVKSAMDVQRGLPVTTPTSKQSRLPIAMASLLFFLWGFAYGLLDTMNAHVKGIMNIGSDKSALLAAAYYSAYPPAAFLIGWFVINRSGYRPTFILGLTIFGLGNFLVAAAANGFSLGGMVGGFLVVGFGIATLERSANPYTVRCGPTNSRAIRINLAQAMAGVGTVIAPLVAKVFLLSDGPVATDAVVARAEPTSRNAMKPVVTLYQGVGAIVLGIAVIFGFIFFGTKWVPEVPREERQKGPGFWKHPLWNKRMLWLGALANFWNLGCQVTVAQNVMDYAREVNGSTLAKGAIYLSVAQALFVVGRFTFAFLCKVFKLKPRHVLLGFNLGCIVFSTSAVLVPDVGGIATLMIIMFFEGPTFPTIFETATTGLGEYASLGEDIMIASISGGALLPPLFGLLADAVGSSNKGTAKAFAIVAFCFSLVLSYVLSINVCRSFRTKLDKANNDEGATSGSNAEPIETAPSNRIPLTEVKPGSAGAKCRENLARQA